MILIDEKCTHCEACKQICPTNAIQWESANTGIKKLVVDENKCIDCHACEKVCHLLVDLKNSEVGNVYAAVSKDQEMLKHSTSGGIFSELAKYYLNSAGVVYGCAFTEKMKAKHIRINKPEELNRLQGSKYVESDVSTSFERVKQDLDEGTKVLFSGTPCQVAGLKAFLRKDYDNLLTVDLICHGVAPQTAFDKYIHYLEKKYDGKMLDYSFRSKSNRGWSLAGEYTVKNRKGVTIKKKAFYFNEYYYYYFLKGYIYNKSCYACKYTDTKRSGDITLGDFWGVEKISTVFNVSNGCSLVITNSSKGDELFKQLDLYYKSSSIDVAKKGNRQLSEPCCCPSNYSELYERVVKWDPQKTQRLFVHENLFQIIKGKIKYSVPTSLIALLKGKSKND